MRPITASVLTFGAIIAIAALLPRPSAALPDWLSCKCHQEEVNADKERPPLELDSGHLPTCWIGNDRVLDRYAAVSLRLNHAEYGDWKTGINHANAYISYRRWW